MAVKDTRRITKRDMVRNGATPVIEVPEIETATPTDPCGFCSRASFEVG